LYVAGVASRYFKSRSGVDARGKQEGARAVLARGLAAWATSGTTRATFEAARARC
jgi:hypothetical protein